MNTASPAALVLPALGTPRVPAPFELQPPADGEQATGCYVVIVGQEVGIFYHWLDSAERVNGVPGGTHKRYNTWDDALQLYTRKYNEGALRIIPIRGSRFWPTSAAPAITTATVAPPSTTLSPASSDEDLWSHVQDFSEVDLSEALSQATLG
ncbi:hypothetical protein HYDPIDRAFT_34188 [Hydnomerulius pinastri MD-312]|uniref:Ribonuclease H1 N-terminal domain-containing protein n=1 Tax=Hydnomerulius pinastri MD-312 TaxID=994086 RepID=A0A0C9UZH6_9AGAM|nr:hypothetical protein HYDPIDRAFT_34188 [Hydnomerulius pinastri MD-312]